MSSKKSTPRHKLLKTKDKEKNLESRKRNDTLPTGNNNSHDSRFHTRNREGPKKVTVFLVLKKRTVIPNSTSRETNFQEQRGNQGICHQQIYPKRTAQGSFLSRKDNKRTLRTSGRKNNEKGFKKLNIFF